MRILIIGGAGLLGQQLAAVLSQAGNEIAIADNFSGSIRYRTSDKHRIFTPNAADANALRLPIQSFDPEVIILSVAHYYPRDVIYRFYEDTRLVINSANALCSVLTPRVKHVYYFSGHEVYGGPQARKPIKEDRKITRSATHHGAAELVAEQLLDFRCNELGIPYTVLRIFDLYGPRIQFCARTGVVSFIIDLLLRGEPVGLVGATRKRDFIHVEDAAQAALQVIKSEFCGVVNVGTGRGTTLRDIAHSVRDKLESSEGLWELKDGVIETYSSVANTTRLKEIAPKWKPSHNVLEDLDNLIEFRKKELNIEVRSDPLLVLNAMRGIQSV